MKQVSHHFIVCSVMVAVELLSITVLDADDTATIITVLVGEDVDLGRNPNLKGSATAVGWPTTMHTRATS